MSQILGLGLHDKGNIGHLGTVWELVILINATPLVLYLKKNKIKWAAVIRPELVGLPIQWGVDTGLFLHTTQFIGGK